MAKIVEITDLSAPELDVYARLTEAQLRSRRDPGNAMFIAESAKVIGHALDAGFEPVSLLMEQRQMAGQGAEVLPRCGDIPVYTAPREVLEQLTGYRLTRGILCAMRRREPARPAEICAGARRVAVLESIVDPANMGAIIRSAAALGLDGVLLTPECIDPMCRRAVRVSMGTVFQVPWAWLGADWQDEMKRFGFRTAALALDSRAIPVDDPALKAEEKLAIVLGTEGDGLKSETIAGCDYTVIIPMAHGVDSLNVAAAAAVAFWELQK